MDSFEWNKISAGVLVSGLIALTSILIADSVYSANPPEVKGYKVDLGVESSGQASAKPEGPTVMELLSNASPEKGASVFKRCASCHTVEQGGANKIGPNLWGIIGNPVAGVAGFSYSEALKGKAGANWTFETMAAWLENPRTFAPGNKMSFAGIYRKKDLASLISYLNKMDSSPQEIPVEASKQASAAE